MIYISSLIEYSGSRSKDARFDYKVLISCKGFIIKLSILFGD